jgi:hypothetical protein
MNEKSSIRNRPNFYGYWITQTGDNSIFFMNLKEEDGEIGGDIEDKLGEGLFFGTKDKDKIEFKKTYTRPVSPYASKATLNYRGDKIKDMDNSYEGKYRVNLEGEDFFGNFIIQPFPESQTMDLLLESFRRKFNL